MPEAPLTQSNKKAHTEPPARRIENTIELQIALARSGFSPGSIDGSLGGQTREALLAYQSAYQLPMTGEFDLESQKVLKIREPIFSKVELSEVDFARIDPRPSSWKERGTRSRMAYNSILEMVAEKSRSDPDLIVKLNPSIDWNILDRGLKILVPNVYDDLSGGLTDHLRISLSKRSLQAIESNGRICFHSPVSIARRVDKRPLSLIHI